MNPSTANENILLEQLSSLTLTKSNLNELLQKCSKSEFGKVVENCFARVQIDGHTLIGRISGVCFPVKVQSFQFGLRFHLALIGLIPLEQILDEMPSSPEEFIPWVEDLKKFKMDLPSSEKIAKKFDELNKIFVKNWNQKAKINKESRENIEHKGENIEIRKEKCPEGTIRNKKGIPNVGVKNVEESLEKEDENVNQQPTTSKTNALPEENPMDGKNEEMEGQKLLIKEAHMKMYIVEIVGTKKCGDIFRILISPKEIDHLLQLGEEEFERTIKGVFIHFRLDSMMQNLPGFRLFKRFVAQIEGIKWTRDYQKKNQPIFIIKHFGPIQFQAITDQQVLLGFMKICLETMNDLGIPPPNKDFISQKYEQLTVAFERTNYSRRPILTTPPTPIPLLSLMRKSPPVVEYPFPTTSSTISPPNFRGTILHPTNVPNHQIWQQPMFHLHSPNQNVQQNQNELIIADNPKADRNEEEASPDIICLDPNTPKTAIQFDFLTKNQNNAVSSQNNPIFGGTELQKLLQKENMQKINNILQKILQEKENTKEKEGNNAQVGKTFSPKKQIDNEKMPLDNRLKSGKRRASASSSASSEEEKRTEKRQRIVKRK